MTISRMEFASDGSGVKYYAFTLYISCTCGRKWQFVPTLAEPSKRCECGVKYSASGFDVREEQEEAQT